MFGSLGSATVEDRRLFFSAYMQAVLQLTPRPSDLNTFLEMSKHMKMQGGVIGTGPRQATIEDFELLKTLGKQRRALTHI